MRGACVTRTPSATVDAIPDPRAATSGRHDPDDEPGQHRESEAVEQDAGIHRQRLDAKEIGRRETDQCTEAPACQRDAERTAGRGQQHGLNDELAHDCQPS